MKWYENVHFTMKTGMTQDGNFYGKFVKYHTLNTTSSFSRILNNTQSSNFYRKVILCHSEYKNSFIGDSKVLPEFTKANNFTFSVPKKRANELFKRFHKRAKTNSKYEIIPTGRFKKFAGRYILLIKNDTPADTRLKFCGDGGW
ncbi:MAG: hypothetical protein N4A45_09830 [Flavobacteriales bacterium]|nr:hypothetical protein [Flavobacteriales bacterium]